MNFTAEQQNALDAGGRVLVSAAAGSGKTAVLVEKVVNLISDENNPVDVDKMLVVTFTNAAAAEMKSRISKSLSEKIKENPNDFNLRKQKLLLPSSFICTIDSLCISLAKEYFYKLGLPYDFKIADNSAVEKLKNECMDDLLDKYFSSDDKDFFKLVSAFGTERADENLRNNIFKIYDYLCSLPFPDEYIEKINNIYADFDENSIFFDIVFNYTYEILKNSYGVFKKYYNMLLEEPELSGFYGDAFAEISAKFVRAIKLVENRDYNGIYNMMQLYSNARLKAVRNYENTDFKLKMQNAKKSAEGTFSNIKGIFNSSLTDIFEDVEHFVPIIDKFLKLTKEFSEMLYKEKKENNCFGFADIEMEVLKLLVKRENGKIAYTDDAKELSKKYSCVLVDEYQDTNDLQDTIFNALSDDGKKLFMVGDVKQSIYGFRKANPRNFLKNRNELPVYKENSEKSKVIMSGNFRSADGICDFVNFVFFRLFSEKCGEMFYEKEDELVPLAKFSPIDEPRVSLDIIDRVVNGCTSTQTQAMYISNIIKNTVDNKPIISTDDGLRKAEYKDICILLRSRKEMSAFVDVFKAAGIPVWVDDNEGLLAEREIVNLFALLQVIDNPFADIPLLTLLTGDIYNFSADEVAKMRVLSKDTELYRALLKYAENNEKAQTFLNDINEFREIASSSSVSSLINKVLSITGYENTVFLYENGESAYNNLLLFKDIAKNFEETTSRGLSAFVGYIKRQIKLGNTMQKSSSTGENDNAVRVMTMHRSKGLQFPICILACLEKKFNSEDSKQDVLISEKCGIGIKYFDEKRKIKYSTLPRNAIAIENSAVAISEEMRLLYVAMTRAKDKLYLVGLNEKYEDIVIDANSGLSLDEKGRFNPYYVLGCNNYLKMLISCAYFHKNSGPLREIVDDNPPQYESMPIEVNIIEDFDFISKIENSEQHLSNFNEEKYKKLCETLEFKYRYKDLNKIFVKQSASNLAHKEFSADFDFTNEPVFVRHQKLSAAQKGTAMHKFMQYCDFEKASQSVENEIDRLVKNGNITNDEAKSLSIDSLKSFFNSSIGEEILKSKGVFREQSFMVEVPADAIYDDLGKEFENENIIIQGFADLCYFEKDGIFIVDYKTDRADESELVKRYKTQLDIYGLALSQTFNKKVIKKAIFSFYLKKLIVL